MTLAKSGGFSVFCQRSDGVPESDDMTKRWQMVEKEDAPCGERGSALAEGFGLHPVACRLFSNRGLKTAEEIADFIQPDWDRGVNDPALFKQMPEAVARVFKALERGEKVTVHGDYDADGVTGSAVLISTLRELERLSRAMADGPGAVTYEPTDGPGSAISNVDSYIPHRDKEGYGLHPVTVDYLKERGTSLLITVDCGVANVAEIAKAKALGIETIVVDHHQFGDELPDAILIHPKVPGETYPFKDLAAVGVAWKLACALCVEARRRALPLVEGFEKWLLDFVSIATVTDMVPLLGENRVLETYGIKVLNKTRRPGMRMLIKSAGYEPGALDTNSVAFGLGPRINAAGRMDHASLALKLMLAENDEEATILAERLEEQNRERQKAMQKMIEEAETQFAVMVEAPSLAFWSETWSPSLVGLVAGKFLDRTGKPTIAIGRHGERWVGSGRSYNFFDVTAAVRRAGDGILTHVGGHVQACGFSFPQEVEAVVMVERFLAEAAAVLADSEVGPILWIDAELGLSEVNWDLVATLQKFEPFGEGNRRPVFMTRGLRISSCDLVGQAQNHLRCAARDADGRSAKFIGFNFGKRAEEFSPGSLVDIAYEVGVNEWNGRRDIQCKLVDVRRAEDGG